MFADLVSDSILQSSIYGIAIRVFAISKVDIENYDKIQLKYCFPLQLHICVTLDFLHFFFFLRAAPMPYGGSQARGPTGAIAVGLRHSHSNTGSELHL